MRRRYALIAACLVAVLLVGITALPWWLEPALARVGRSWGATFGAYERIGYTRFALRDVVVQRSGVRVTVSRIEADTPLVWLWLRWTGRPKEVMVWRWMVDVVPSETSAATPQHSTERGWMPLRAILMRVAAGLDDWLPLAKTEAGSVRWPGGGLALTSATWTGRTLAVENLAFGSMNTYATLAFPLGEDAMKLTLRTPDGFASANLESRGAKLDGDVMGWEQAAALHAQFGSQGWMPSAATLQANAWQVPAERLKLGELYATVVGHGNIVWRDGRFTTDVMVSAIPATGKSAPPLEAALRAHGDAETITVDAMYATLPGITAKLSEPVTVDRQGNFRQSAARFTLQMDLAKQPWIAASGTVSGEARLVANVSRPPVIGFDLEVRNGELLEVPLGAATVKGRYEWPRVEITAGTVAMAGDETITFRGGWDFRTKEVFDASVSGQTRRATLARWLPALPDFDAISITARASGPLASLTHTGSAQARGVKLSGANPLALASTWRGHGTTIDDFTAEAIAGTSRISVTGSATPTEAHLTGLTLARGGATHLKLTAPATVRWSPAMQIDRLQLAGDGDMHAAVTWAETGRIEIAMQKISSSWFEELVSLPGPHWEVDSLTIDGAWDHGPMRFSATAAAAIDLGDGRAASVAMSVNGDKDGLRVESVHAVEGTTLILTASGRLPLVLSAGSDPLVQIKPNGTLLVEVSTGANSVFWEKLAELTGVVIEEPQATVHVTGTWARPLGEMRAKASHIALDPKRYKLALPSLDALDVALTGDRSGIKLESFSAEMEGQTIRAQGRLPVGEGAWDDMRQHPLAYARGIAELHLEVPDANVAAFVRFLPPWLAPKGRVQADISYKRGAVVEGILQVHDAATRALGPLGVLQEINAEIHMAGHGVEFSKVTAKAGGQIVTLGGVIQFPVGATPHYDVSLHGDNLPFIRRTGMLARGDLDLKLSTPTVGPSAISGTVRLHDSLFLSDVRAFLPGGPKGGMLQPPFFAVATPPFASWTLGVAVTGDHFLRLRTPVFTGVASARFRLDGTLGEPRAIGEVKIEEGQVLMPFASFAVQQGTVRISEENPHELTLFLRGTGRRYSYDLGIEITGTAESPIVLFSSNPVIESEQLLLMVMTGAAPSNEIAYSSRQRFARFGAYLGQGFLGSLWGDAGEADRLSVTSGEKVSRQGRETYEFEYKLGERWKWVGEYNEFDEYNVGLKWRFYPSKRESEAPHDAPK
jgi:translocation and assembly module TamB